MLCIYKRLKPLSLIKNTVAGSLKKNSLYIFKFFFLANNILKISVQHPFIISKSKPKSKISFKMLFSWVNFGFAQWILRRTVNLLPTMIKSHMGKTVIKWSINPDVNNNIEGSKK